MTQVAVLHGPGESAVVTSTAILPVHDLDHIDIVAASFELEAEIAMAYFAGEADAVKPVWKYHGSNVLCIRVVVDDYIAVFGTGEIVENQAIAQHECVYQQHTDTGDPADCSGHPVCNPDHD